MRWFRPRRAHDKLGTARARGNDHRENNCEKSTKLGPWLKGAGSMRRGLPVAAHALAMREETEGPPPPLRGREGGDGHSAPNAYSSRPASCWSSSLSARGDGGGVPRAKSRSERRRARRSWAFVATSPRHPPPVTTAHHNHLSHTPSPTPSPLSLSCASTSLRGGRGAHHEEEGEGADEEHEKASQQ
jgi:hypothetical protein